MLKKYIFAILFLLLASAAARAEMYVGARYGGALSLIYFTPNKNEGMLFSPINTAVAFRYCNEKAQDYERFMNILMEVGYGERGYTIGPDSLKTSVTSQALEVPFMMQARIPVAKHVHALVTGIVYGAYYLRNGSTEVFPELKDRVRNYEYGIGGGLGLCLNFGKMDFALDARYMASMSYLVEPNIALYESMPMQVVISFSVMRKIGK
ncbi:MAG: hypothetical protein LBU92_04540 [Prevotellaceae bacterium]|nr:hypothetical protein [Prevotellaceae bacterium]